MKTCTSEQFIQQSDGHLDITLDESEPIFKKITKPVLLPFAQHILMKHNIMQVQDPSLSPNLFNFFLFSKVKIHLKAITLADMKNIFKNATVKLHTLSKEDIQRCFNQ